MGSIVFASMPGKPPDPDGAAVALRRTGFEVTMLPEKLQSRLVNSEDDFIEASMDGTDYDELVLAIMAKINAIVGRYRAIPSRQTMSRLRGYSTCRVKEDQPTSGRNP